MYKREVYFYQLINLSWKQKDWIRALPYSNYVDRHSVGGWTQTIPNWWVLGSWCAMHRQDIDYVFSLLDEWFVNTYYTSLESIYPTVSKSITRQSIPVYCRNISGRVITINANPQFIASRLPNNTPWDPFGKKTTFNPKNISSTEIKV